MDQSQTRESTIYDVARKAGVSPSIVSKVLNDAPDVAESTRLKVLQVMDTLDFRPRRGQGRADLIAFVTRLHAGDFRSLFVSEMFDAVVSEAMAQGYLPLVISLDRLRQERNGIRHFMRKTGVRGLLIRAQSEDDPVVQELAREGIPHVLLNRKFDVEGANYVVADGFQGAYSATQHLLKLGHRRIGLVGNPTLISTSFRERIDGYEQAHRDLGFEIDPSLYFFPNGIDMSAGRQAAYELWSHRYRPTAAITFFEQVGLGFFITIQQLGGSIPDDLSVVTFDEVPGSSHFNPALTTLKMPSDQIARVAVDALTQLISGNASPGSIRMKISIQLEVRTSTQPLG